MSKDVAVETTSRGLVRSGRLFLTSGVFFILGALVMPSAAGTGPAVLLAMVGVGFGLIAVHQLRELQLDRALEAVAPVSMFPAQIEGDSAEIPIFEDHRVGRERRTGRERRVKELGAPRAERRMTTDRRVGNRRFPYEGFVLEGL